MCGGWYVQAYRNVAGRSMAPSATIDPRLRKRPAPAAVLPNTTTVPAIIALPVRGPAFPVTTMSPRRAAALALDSEEVAERRPAAAVYDRQPGDLPLAQRGEPVRGDVVGHE